MRIFLSYLCLLAATSSFAGREIAKECTNMPADKISAILNLNVPTPGRCKTDADCKPNERCVGDYCVRRN